MDVSIEGVLAILGLKEVELQTVRAQRDQALRTLAEVTKNGSEKAESAENESIVPDGGESVGASDES